MSGDRDAVLGRIREALQVPAPRHHHKPAAPYSNAPAAK